MIDINHIAKLARIGLKEDELKKLEGELSAILDFIEKLKEVDIENIEPMTGGTDLANAVREDESIARNEEQRKMILANAPKRKDNYIEVKAVFE
jgi:aspartyl-tRNA(Asn)/glutamyl-tRNA(Gln) amidotransferase subunit C